MIENEPNPIKLYTRKAILASTYIGGPIAGGLLARKNFLNLGQKELAKNAIILSIAVFISILVLAFITPEEITSKIPKFLIPLIYTLITYFLVEKYQGKELEEHKKNEGEFYSAWRAFGISMICILTIGAIFFGFYKYEVSHSISDADIKKYDEGINQFKINESKALELYTIPDTCKSERSIRFIDSVGIPNWQTNAKIIEDLNKIEGIPEKTIKQNDELIKYCSLRIQTYQLMKRSLVENTTKYDGEIYQTSAEINSLLKGLEEIERR